MRTIRNALLYTLAVATLVPGCADEKHASEPSAAPETVGTLELALETTAASGTRYRLRQAVFLVDRSTSPRGLPGGTGGLGGLVDAGFIGGLFGGGDTGGGLADGGFIGGLDTDGGFIGGLFGGATAGGPVGGGLVGGDFGSTVGGIVGGDFGSTVGGIVGGAATGGAVGGFTSGGGTGEEPDGPPGGGGTGGVLAGFSGGGGTGGVLAGGGLGGDDSEDDDDVLPMVVPGTGGILGGLFADAGTPISPAQDIFAREITLDSEDNPLAPEIRKELPAGSYRIFLQSGWFLERIEGNQAVEVAATLIGSPTVFTTIDSGGVTLLGYVFETSGEVVRFEKRGTLTITPIVIETKPDGGIDDGGTPPDFGAVIELNRGALESFSLSEVLERVASNAGLPSNPTLLYQTLIDSYASVNNARLPNARHCGDEVTDGTPSLNGFPLRCDRREALQFENLRQWFATALVSRIDLAPEDGSHCGQQRMVFANNANGRIFMILEAQIANPHPECGIDGCRPLAQAWLDLSTSDPGSRGKLLREMFLTGSASLTAAGFPAFISANNMTVGSGTIRTNNFDDDPWTLREFKVVVSESGDEVIAAPFPVAESPRGELWNDLSTLPVAETCRANFLEALSGVLTDNPARMRFIVEDACKNSESQNDFFTEDYASHLAAGSGAFAREIEARIAGTGLSATDIANRARFGGSCIGCHQEASGTFLGRGVFAPLVRDFPQILEFVEACPDGTVNCSAISPGLRDVFLPHRQDVQNTLLSRRACGGSTDPGMPPGVDAGSPQDAGTPPLFDGGIVRPPVLTTVEELLAADDLARSNLSGLTLGGQPARTTH